MNFFKQSWWSNGNGIFNELYKKSIDQNEMNDELDSKIKINNDEFIQTFKSGIKNHLVYS